MLLKIIFVFTDGPGPDWATPPGCHLEKEPEDTQGTEKEKKLDTKYGLLGRNSLNYSVAEYSVHPYNK